MHHVLPVGGHGKGTAGARVLEERQLITLEGMLSKPTLPFSDAGSLSTAAATATRSLTAAVTAVRVEPG